MTDNLEQSLQNPRLIGVDIGGTKISAGLVADGEVLASIQVANPAHADVDIITGVLLNTIQEVMSGEVAAIGIGIPGLVDAPAGVVHEIKNIPALSGFPLSEFLSRELQLPVFLNNDANCYAVGEKYFGMGKAFNNLVAFTLGTGLGAGLILDGRLYNGKIGGAGEFGSLRYLDNNLEYYCSSEFFKKEYQTDSLTLVDHAAAGDHRAQKIFREYGQHVGEAISFALSVLDPQIVVLGGSIANAYGYFAPGMQVVLDNYPLRRISENIKVVVGSLSDSAILGAAALYFDNQNRKFDMGA